MRTRWLLSQPRLWMIQKQLFSRTEVPIPQNNLLKYSYHNTMENFGSIFSRFHCALSLFMRISSIRTLPHQLACYQWSLEFSSGHHSCCTAARLLLSKIYIIRTCCTRNFQTKFFNPQNKYIATSALRKTWFYRRIFVGILTSGFASSSPYYWFTFVTEIYASCNKWSVRNLLISASTKCA